MTGTKNTVMPDAYQGREQAYIKHRLLESYLEKLFMGFCRSWHDGNLTEPVWRVAASRFLAPSLNRGSYR